MIRASQEAQCGEVRFSGRAIHFGARPGQSPHSRGPFPGCRLHSLGWPFHRCLCPRPPTGQMIQVLWGWGWENSICKASQDPWVICMHRHDWKPLPHIRGEQTSSVESEIVAFYMLPPMQACLVELSLPLPKNQCIKLITGWTFLSEYGV